MRHSLSANHSLCEEAPFLIGLVGFFLNLVIGPKFGVIHLAFFHSLLKVVKTA